MKPGFIVDVNVGRLVEWLRAIGYDTSFVPDKQLTEVATRWRYQKR